MTRSGQQRGSFGRDPQDDTFGATEGILREDPQDDTFGATEGILREELQDDMQSLRHSGLPPTTHKSQSAAPAALPAKRPPPCKPIDIPSQAAPAPDRR